MRIQREVHPTAAAPSSDAGKLPVAMDAEVQQDSGNPVAPALDAAMDASAPSLQPDAEPPDATVPDGAAEDVTDAGSPEDVYEHVGPGQGVSSDPLCDQIKACGGDITVNYGQICRARLGAAVSDAYFAAVQAAPCSDHEIENPPYMDVCHPPCEDIGSWCNNDLTASACRPLPAVDSNAVIPRGALADLPVGATGPPQSRSHTRKDVSPCCVTRATVSLDVSSVGSRNAPARSEEPNHRF